MKKLTFLFFALLDMYKTWFILSLMLLLLAIPIEAKKKSKNSDLSRLPYPLTEMAAKHDSILHEAYMLYLKEIIAWNAEDVFFADCTHQDELQGMLVCGAFPSYSDIFYNLDTRQCVFEVKIDVEKGALEEIDSIRPLTGEELAEIELQKRLYEAAAHLDVQVNEPPEGCTFNLDWIRVDDNRYRVFIIMGCNKPHVIPWGNDLSYDCDSQGNILDVRKYHHTSILMPTIMDGQPVREIAHSHTDLHPLITSTDIALFLLYAEDINCFKVYSGGIYYVYDKRSNQINIVTP